VIWLPSEPGRWIHLAVAASLVLVGVLLGSGIVCPSKCEAQTGSEWSQPQMVYDGMVDTYRIDLVSDRFGAAHLVWKLADEGTYYYSRWSGMDWTTPIDIVAATGVGNLQRPALVAAADGKLHLFWVERQLMHSWAWVTEAADSARAWSRPEAIAYLDGATDGLIDAKQDRLGTFHLVYAAWGDVYYMRALGDGLTLTTPAAVSLAGDFTAMGAPRLDVGPDDHIHVVWDEWPLDSGPAQSSEVYYSRSTDGGRNWSEPRQLGDVANRGGNVLTAGDNTVYVAWQAGIMSPNSGRFVQRSRDGGNTWEGSLSFSVNRGQSGYPSMGLDSQGTLHIISGDGEYAFWNDRSISAPLDLRPVLEQTENARLAIVNGNQVLVVMGPFSGPGLYYAARSLPIPGLPTATLPVRAPTPATPAAAASAEWTGPTGAPGATTAVHNGALPADGSGSSTVPTLLLPMGLSLVLVAGLLIVRLGRRCNPRTPG
jgi:hypothetical protein